MREQQHRGMGLQRVPHRLDLGAVVVDVRVEAAAEDGPAQRRDQVDGEPAPSGGELVEHLAGLLEGRARDLLEALAKPRRRQHLRLDQPRRLVFGPEQPQLDAFDGQARAADDETREVPRVFADGGVAPLLTQLGDLRGLAGDHPGARRVLAQDASLQDLRRPVGVAARQQRRRPWTAWAGRPAPRTPAPARRSGRRRLRVPRRAAQASPGGGSSSPGSSQHVDLGSGCSRALLFAASR